MEGRVVRICIAPVKALHVVNPDEVELTHAGVAGDRRFWLVDRNRRLVNGKDHPELMRVQPEWDEASRRLALAFPDGSVVEGEVEPGEPFEAELYGTPHPSRTVPGPWQEALSEFVGEPLTLLWSEARRTGPRKRPRRLGNAHLSRLARAPGRGGRRNGAGRRPPLPDAVRDRRRRAARGGHLAR